MHLFFQDVSNKVIWTSGIEMQKGFYPVATATTHNCLSQVNRTEHRKHERSCFTSSNCVGKSLLFPLCSYFWRTLLTLSRTPIQCCCLHLEAGRYWWVVLMTIKKPKPSRSCSRAKQILHRHSGMEKLILEWVEEDSTTGKNAYQKLLVLVKWPNLVQSNWGFPASESSKIASDQITFDFQTNTNNNGSMFESQLQFS